ncbi:MAG: hypothetical protein US76_03515 [Parcubacteria group bacterium GW2011_GWA2_38_13b]|nr:MAG: hypothetical protein US76_03515 [Parcubacteria group bacterium GW2011_GWA2_38_13b]
MKKSFEAIGGSENNERFLSRIKILEFELAKTRKELTEIKKSSITDSKTGAYNVHYMNQEMPRILNEIFAYHKFEKGIVEHKRAGLIESASVVFFDLDGFKSANDKFGHVAVDDLLKYLVDNIRSKTRWGDFLVRHGGDEFILVLLNIDAEEAEKKAENLRRLVEEIGRNFGVTASVGLANYKLNMGFRNFIDMADKAAMESKKSGKNRVTVAE